MIDMLDTKYARLVSVADGRVRRNQPLMTTASRHRHGSSFVRQSIRKRGDLSLLGEKRALPRARRCFVDSWTSRLSAVFCAVLSPVYRSDAMPVKRNGPGGRWCCDGGIV